MLSFVFAPTFVRMLGKLEPSLQEEAIEKLELFKCEGNHQQLKVHKLKGQFKGCYSFSVNYKYRVVFSYKDCDIVNLLAIGGHEVYK